MTDLGQKGPKNQEKIQIYINFLSGILHRILVL